MTLLRRFGAVSFCAATVALGAAAPAAADLLPPADGYYTYSGPGQPTARWEIGTICIQANGTRAQPDYTDTTIQTLGCTVNIASDTPNTYTTEEKLLSVADGRARLTSGLWTLSNFFSTGLECPDGSKAPISDTFAFDAVTLTGTRTTTWGAECGGQPGMTKQPFTLGFQSPLDPPMVERFPDTCNYLAGRPSICS